MRIQSSYKFKMMVSLSVLLSGVIIFSSVAIYVKTMTTVKDQAIAGGNSTITQLKSSVEVLLDVMRNSVVQASLDTDLESFMDRYELLDIFDCEALYRRLTQLRSANKYIDKLYVYYRDYKKAIDVNGSNARIVDLDDVEEKEILIEADRMGLLERYDKPFPIYSLWDSNHQLKLAISVPITPISPNPQATMAVILDQTYFNDILQFVTISNDSMVYVVDKNNQFLFGTKNVTHSNDGLVQENDDSDKYFTVSSVSENTGWKYVYSVPKDQIYATVNSTKTFLLMITFISLAIAAAGVLLLSERLYQPVKRIVKSISSSHLNDFSTDNEIDYINESIKNLISEKKSIEDMLKESRPFLKNQLLLNMLTDTNINTDEAEKKMKYYDINYFANGFYCVCVMKIDHFNSMIKNYSVKQIDTLNIYMSSLLQSCVAQADDTTLEMTRTTDNNTVMFFSVNGDTAQKCEEVLNEQLQSIFVSITQNLGVTITIGVGSICDSVETLNISYAQAVDAYKYRIISGNNKIIRYESIPHTNPHKYVYPLKLEKEIFSALKRCDNNEIEKAVTQYFDALRENLVEYKRLRYISFQLLNSIISFLSEISIDSGLIFDDLDATFDEAVAFDTVDNAKDYFIGIFKLINEYILQRKEGGSEDISDTIIKYINSNYSMEEISLDLLASQLHFSVSYLVKAFKHATGKSIKEYITETRISAAKELIKKDNVKIVDVATKVGYSNARSFINIFKKYTGQTPGEYKDEILRGGIR